MTDSLKTRIGTLAFKEVQKFLNNSQFNLITSFLEAVKDTNTSKITDDQIFDFLKEADPKVSKPKASNGKLAWLGYSAELKAKWKAAGKKFTSKQVGAEWRKHRDTILKDEKEVARLATVATSSAKTKKAPRQKSGNAWIGFLSEFRAKNNAKKDKDPTKLAPKDAISAAAKVWNKGEGRSAEEIARYQKLADANKAAKELEKIKKEEAKAEREAKKAKKAAEKAAKEAQEEDDDDEESDDQETDAASEPAEAEVDSDADEDAPLAPEADAESESEDDFEEAEPEAPKPAPKKKQKRKARKARK